MIEVIKQFFEDHLVPGSSAAADDPEQATRLAVAALLIEVAAADYKASSQERAALLQAVQQRFGLDAEASHELLELAETEHDESTDYFQFTSLINDQYQPRQKIRLVEDLWRIAFADGSLDKYEEHVIRRLAELLHVSHRDFIATKHRVRDAT